MGLCDLVEYRWDFFRRAFVKAATLVTNRPPAICYAEKKKVEFLRPTTRYTVFKVVKNGAKQYSNKF